MLADEVRQEPAVRPPRRFRVPVVLAWLSVVPFAVLVVIRVMGWERGSLLVALVSLTPYAAVGSLVPAGLAVASRNKTAILAATVCAVVLTVLVIPRSVGDSPGATGGLSLRILTANLNEGRAEASSVVDLVRRLRVDVLNLEELTPFMEQRLDVAGLGDLLPHRVVQSGEGPSGTGIYSRWPLTERRGLFHPVGHHMPVAEARIPGGPEVEIVAVHPVAPVPGTATEWATGVRALPPAPATGPPRVLAGDFNATLDHAVLRNLIDTGYIDAAEFTGDGLIATWPVGRRLPPVVTIDHVLIDRRSAAVATSIHTIAGSDHRAVFADLLIRG